MIDCRVYIINKIIVVLCKLEEKKNMELTPVDTHPMRHAGEGHMLNHRLFNLPMRLLVVGASQRSGKTNRIANLLLKKPPNGYRGLFEGENIYIVSPSADTDMKIKTMRRELDIPDSNVMLDYDEDMLMALYDMLEEDFNTAIENDEPPPRTLIFLDDLSFSGALRAHAHGAISKFFCNGRHINLSTIVTSQKYTDIATTCRENATGCILFSCSDKQLELIIEDHNMTGDKRLLKKMFRKCTNERHCAFIVNYDNTLGHGLYMNDKYMPIDSGLNDTVEGAQEETRCE